MEDLDHTFFVLLFTTEGVFCSKKELVFASTGWKQGCRV